MDPIAHPPLAVPVDDAPAVIAASPVIIRSAVPPPSPLLAYLPWLIALANGVLIWRVIQDPVLQIFAGWYPGVEVEPGNPRFGTLTVDTWAMWWMVANGALLMLAWTVATLGLQHEIDTAITPGRWRRIARSWLIGSAGNLLLLVAGLLFIATCIDRTAPAGIFIITLVVILSLILVLTVPLVRPLTAGFSGLGHRLIVAVALWGGRPEQRAVTLARLQSPQWIERYAVNLCVACGAVGLASAAGLYRAMRMIDWHDDWPPMARLALWSLVTVAAIFTGLSIALHERRSPDVTSIAAGPVATVRCFECNAPLTLNNGRCAACDSAVWAEGAL